MRRPLAPPLILTLLAAGLGVAALAGPELADAALPDPPFDLALTDDVGVVGYLVHRNWLFVTFVTAGTAYTDADIAAGARYRYQVRAQDAAGNNSAPTDLLVVDVP